MESISIIDEINNSINDSFNKQMCRFALYQYLKIKKTTENKRDYVGYILQKSNNGSKNQSYSIRNSYISTLNSSKILEEVKNVEIDDYYYELLCQYYEENKLIKIFQNIAKEKQISLPEGLNCFELFNIIKSTDKTIFESYNADSNKRNHDSLFHFRFFKLSSNFADRENLLWTALQPEFGWRNPYKLVRS